MSLRLMPSNSETFSLNGTRIVLLIIIGGEIVSSEVKI